MRAASSVTRWPAAWAWPPTRSRRCIGTVWRARPATGSPAPTPARGGGGAAARVGGVLGSRLGGGAGQGLACHNLGLCYSNGTGVAEDDAQALAWFRRASEAGYDFGTWRVGVHYEFTAKQPGEA